MHIIACTHSFAYLFQSFVKDFRYLTIRFFSGAGDERVFKVSPVVQWRHQWMFVVSLTNLSLLPKKIIRLSSDCEEGQMGNSQEWANNKTNVLEKYVCVENFLSKIFWSKPRQATHDRLNRNLWSFVSYIVRHQEVKTFSVEQTIKETRTQK